MSTRKGEVPFIAQLTPTDCGAASLASVLAYHGKHVPIHELRSALGGGRNGINARQLLAVGRAYGFQARGVAIEPDKLRYLPTGSILHWELAHFLVFVRCDGSTGLVDPRWASAAAASEIGQSLSARRDGVRPGPDFVKQEPGAASAAPLSRMDVSSTGAGPLLIRRS